MTTPVGVHLFNYGYMAHRQGPVSPQESVVALGADKRTGRFTEKNLQALRDLADPEALKGLDRCYYAEHHRYHHAGNYPPQVPRKLALMDRGAGVAHALRIQVDDDIATSLSDGRIRKTGLRLGLAEYEASMSRIRCEVNGVRVDISSARTIRSKAGEEWLVLENPPVKEGVNTILVILERMQTPDPWPTLHGCEIIVRGES